MMNVTKIKKIMIISLIYCLLPLTAYSQQQDRVKEPIRLKEDRKELIELLTDEKVNREALPITKKQNQVLKNNILESEEILNSPFSDPEVMYRSLDVNFNNIRKDETIYLSPNFVTTLLFLDKTGAYWPVENYTLALGSKIQHQALNNGTVIMSPKMRFGKGNMVVLLEDSKIPLILTVEVSSDKVDYKTEIRIADFGPNSSPVIYSGAGTSDGGFSDLSSLAKFVKQEMLLMLDGITPEGYVKREVSTDGIDAWSNGKELYIKTKDQLLSPSLLPKNYNKMKSADDTFIYAIPYLPIVVLSRNGQVINVRVR
jgi:intracellular multiplication protein IcmK